MIPEEDIEKVSENTDFISLVAETTQVRQRGGDYWCCCPFHKEKTPSCKIDPVQKIWHCFGCGEGGTVFTYVMKLYNMTFVEAVHMLAQRANIEIHDTFQKEDKTKNKSKRMKECCNIACDFFHDQLLRGKGEWYDRARKYLSSRNFNIDIAKRWKIGFAYGRGMVVNHLIAQGFSEEEIKSANLAVERAGKIYDRFYERIIFPIFDIQGNCVAFGGRVIGQGNPKYLNSSETLIFHKSRVLFGLDKAKGEIVSSGNAIIVEGYTDVIALSEAGIKNVCATLGTALTLQHIKILNRYATNKIIYLFDGDEAGQRAAMRALQFIDYSMTPEAGQSRCDLYAVTIPNGLDPAEYVSSFGGEKFRDILDSAIPLIEFGINRIILNHDCSTSEGRSRALMEAISILKPISHSILAKDYVRNIATRLRISEQDALSVLSNLSTKSNISKNNINSNITSNIRRTNNKRTKSQVGKREKNEQELISLIIQYPLLAFKYGDKINRIKLQNSLHKMTKDFIFKSIEDNFNITSTTLSNTLCSKIPESSQIIACAMADDEEKAENMCKILISNLLIEDISAEIEQINISIINMEDFAKDKEEALKKIKRKNEEIMELRKMRSNALV